MGGSRQPDAAGQQAQDEGQGDPCDISQGDGDQLEVHGASSGQAEAVPPLPGSGMRYPTRRSVRM